MRSVFFGHYPPTDEERKRLWEQALIVPDTNTLKHFFRFMPTGRDELLAAFNSFGNRLWLPYQAGKEFQDGWRSAAKSNRGDYEKLKAELKKNKGQITASLNNFNRFHPWENNSLIHKIPEFFDDLSREVDAAVAKLPQLEATFEAVTALFDGKVAEQPKESNLDLRGKEAEARRKAKIPPGYMDDGAGDYLIWAEMIEKAKSEKVPVLFITDDSKEDWWWKDSSDNIIGPRPELRYEFFAATGQLFYAYRPDRFLALVRESNSTLVSDATVQEMQRVQNRRLVSASSLRIRSKIRELSEEILLKPGAHEEAVLAYAANIATTLNLIDPTIAARAQGKITGDDPELLQKHADEMKSDALSGVIYFDDGELGAHNLAIFNKLIDLLRDREYWNELEHVLNRLAATRELRERMEEIRQLQDSQVRDSS